MLTGDSLEEGRSLLLACLLNSRQMPMILQVAQRLASGAVSSKLFSFCKDNCPSSAWKNGNRVEESS